MQAKNLKKQAAAKARSAALTPAQRSKIAAKEALQNPSLILRPENFCLLHKLNFCANDCSGYF